MTKLHQLLAVGQGQRQRAQQALAKFYQRVQKPEPFTGLVKMYLPKDEDGEKLPGESLRVQQDAEALLRDLKAALAPMYKVVGDIDRTNQSAKADIIVDGNTLLADVPVATLLWLEKQLADMRTVFNALPILNPEFEWARDTAAGVWKTPERNTTRSKKVPRNHVKAHATDKHPEQVEVFHEDTIVGTWVTRGLSGAMRPTDVKLFQENLEVLRDAVKDARERANSADVVPFDAGPILDHLFQV